MKPHDPIRQQIDENLRKAFGLPTGEAPPALLALLERLRDRTENAPRDHEAAAPKQILKDNH